MNSKINLIRWHSKLRDNKNYKILQFPKKFNESNNNLYLKIARQGSKKIICLPNKLGVVVLLWSKTQIKWYITQHIAEILYYIRIKPPGLSEILTHKQKI